MCMPYQQTCVHATTQMYHAISPARLLIAVHKLQCAGVICLVASLQACSWVDVAVADFLLKQHQSMSMCGCVLHHDCEADERHNMICDELDCNRASSVDS